MQQQEGDCKVPQVRVQRAGGGSWAPSHSGSLCEPSTMRCSAAQHLEKKREQKDEDQPRISILTQASGCKVPTGTWLLT